MLSSDQGRNILRARSFLVPTIIVFLVAYLMLSSSVGFGNVMAAIAAIDLRVLALVLLLSLANYALRFWRWSLMLSPSSTALPPSRHFMIYLSGFALTTTPGKVGEALRTFYLRPFSISPGRCLAALYNERLFDLVAIGILSMFAVVSSGAVTRTFGLLGAGLVAVLIVAQHPATIARLERLSRFLPGRLVPSLTNAATTFLRDVRSMMTVRFAAIGTFLGLLAWGAEGIGTYVVARELGLHIGPALAIGIYATAMLAGALSFLPGGLGSTEIVMISLLAYAGATAPEAVATTTVVRLATLWFAVALGLGAWSAIEALPGPIAAGSGHTSERKSPHAASPSDPEGR
ncbi:lysylphosphatidylglycerol synthase transmembrane domain-containing protein [Mesorhizobium sp. VK24D]|uniref:Lysylphosphatidylglycerol synthase transmembrane domain-containing protein n=1 Tax=Mesorhizobium album TaxID=3072314 RepID=A0ABU4Y2F8_9HYPH|nr:lysylphosphatidylglycerol synthase transmembrane domain-containing protein [Mesorhizobium sp. VK24D]MDX8481139.1 lysylphosphatidylglycerol synthase transmembrane domain-containing protein [Mesorhizobium sp. VK24D]